MSSFHIAGARFAYKAGTAGTVTLPSSAVLVSIQTHASAGGATLIITPGGANQVATAGDAIPVPSGANWLRMGLEELGAELGVGTVLTFTGTDAYVVVYALLKSG